MSRGRRRVWREKEEAEEECVCVGGGLCHVSREIKP